jgi:hypothetical protein
MRYKLAAVMVMATPLVAFRGAVPVLATSGLGCTTSSTYGSTCEKVFGTGLQVTDIAGYFTPPNNDFFTGKTWSFELTVYSCSPNGYTKAQCPPISTYYSKSRSGNPPQQGSNCASVGGSSLTYQQCQSYGMAQVLASHGDWPTYTVPKTYSATRYLCTEVAVYVSGHWVDNGPAGSKGYRACQTVHS